MIKVQPMRSGPSAESEGLMKIGIALIAASLLTTEVTSAHARHETADTLDMAVVTAEKGLIVTRTDTVKFSHGDEISHTLNCIPGITMTDMGGYAGLKTISLRGMGSAGTVISVDGIRIGNMQSGQSDIGMLDLKDYSSVIIDYIHNSIDFISAEPSFVKSGDGTAGKLSGHAGITSGSFGTYIPSIGLNFLIDENISMKISAGGHFSKGNYPYIAESPSGNAIEITRENNDYRRYDAGIDVFGKMEEGRWHIKGYFSSADRGAPGSVTWPAQDRQKDRNAFLQGKVLKISGSYRLDISGKLAFDDMIYESSWGNSRYTQKEVRINTSHTFSINRWLKASVAVGGYADDLESGNYGSAGIASEGIIRTGVQGSISGAVSLNALKAEMALEYDGMNDREGRTGLMKLHSLSPSAGIRLKLNENIGIHACGRKSFRAPVFNELYYIGFGNKELKPEDAWMSSAGFNWDIVDRKAVHIEAGAEGFFNILKNKITSAPSGYDPNIWLPFNIGKVRNIGFDIMTALKYRHAEAEYGFHARYSYQRATDRTDGSISYGLQIPYVPVHGFSSAAFASWKGLKGELCWNFKGDRKDSNGSLPDWNTLDISISKDFKSSNDRSTITIRISGRNLLNYRYELSRGYPMPGRSFMSAVMIQF